MKNILYITFLSLCISYSTYAQTVGGFSPATSYYNTSRMLEFTNRLFGTNYNSVPNSPNKGYITSPFLAARGASSACTPSCTQHLHKGLDQGTNGQNVNIYSPIPGVVTAVGGSTGKVCIYNSTHDITLVILHCSSIAVNTGDPISINTYLGKADQIGNATGIHTHTEIRKGNKAAGACPCLDPNVDLVYDPLIVVDLFPATTIVDITNPLDGSVGVDHNNPINIAWAPVSGATSYRVNVTTNPNNFDDQGNPMFPNGIVVNSNVGNTTNYSFTGASGNTTYYVVVRAFIQSLGVSYVSHIISFTTQQSGTSCNPSSYDYDEPLWLTANYNNGTVNLGYYNNTSAPYIRVQISDYSTYTDAQGFYCDDSDINFTGSTSGGELYYNQSSPSNSNQNNSLPISLNLDPGTYCVTARVGYSGAQSKFCQPTCFTVSSPTSLDEIPYKKPFYIRPNPVEDYLMWDNSDLVKYICIYNMAGQKIKTIRVTENDVNISDLPTGLYYLRMYGGDWEELHGQKIVKR